MSMKDDIRAILLEHRGKENAITSQELSEALGDIDRLDSTPITRKLIRDLVRNDHLPIGACSSGYFVIETQDELNEYIVSLTHREAKIKQRRQEVVRAVNSNDDFLVQTGLGAFL